MLTLFAALLLASGPHDTHIRYEVDVSDTSDDLFHVTVHTGPLTEDDRYFDFVAFAPGVHSILNLGRFVKQLEAFDAEGKAIAVEQLAMNRWELSEPTSVARIVYAVEDTFDAEVEEHKPVPMAGSGIEDDYVLMNTHAVLGYFEQHLECPVELTVERDPEWLVGTPLTEKDGVFRAPSYRYLADSPFLMGDLTTTGIWMGDIEVEIFVHSRTSGLGADEVLFVAGDVLEAAATFIGFAPVDRYVFLFDLFDMQSMRRNQIRSMGALEHSYSSLYTVPGSTGSLAGLSGTIAHEFMHILTPLHLKSTIIADFDYSIPTTDRHVWLYEGATEWSADMLRLKGGIFDLDHYLETLTGKIRRSRRFDPEYSLERISLEWFTDEGQPQYGNIYQLGALTAAVLDLRLLELSGGERGLRDVFFEFVGRYGPDKPFDDETFFDEFVAATYPEIAAFFREHVQGNEPLPYAEAFATVGVSFNPDSGVLSVNEDASAEQQASREAWAH